MFINGDTIIADDSKHFVRKSDGVNYGRTITLGYTYYIGGEKLAEPQLETPADFEEIDDQEG